MSVSEQGPASKVRTFAVHEHASSALAWACLEVGVGAKHAYLESLTNGVNGLKDANIEGNVEDELIYGSLASLEFPTTRAITYARSPKVKWTPAPKPRSSSLLDTAKLETESSIKRERYVRKRDRAER